jgi:hypothetical protein
MFWVSTNGALPASIDTFENIPETCSWVRTLRCSGFVTAVPHMSQPSVATLLDLMKDPSTDTNTIDVLAPSLAEAPPLMARLQQLPEVARVTSLRALPRTKRPAYLPTPPPPPAPSASATYEPDDQQQYQRADGGVDNRRNNAQAKMDGKLRKHPSTDEGADDSNKDIADDPKPCASHDLTGQPSGDEADH